MKIFYSQKSLEDLTNLEQFLLNNWDEKTAAKTLNKIMASIDLLADFPHMGQRLSSLINIPSKHYFIYSEKNYIFYFVENKDIKIVRVIHEKKNHIAELFK